MEEVRLLVQEEGRAARNLIAFHVPVDLSNAEPGKLVAKKPPTSPRQQADWKKDEILRTTKRSCESSKPGSRVRSASTGRDKKSELQARYWAFLFGNLQRAVDEIYQTCETDESIAECKEVILVLDNFTRDFHSLIEWFKLKWEYENTPPPQRPTSLAWEVRKSSPGKVQHPHAVEKKLGVKGPVKRQLDFISAKNSTLQEAKEGIALNELCENGSCEQQSNKFPPELKEVNVQDNANSIAIESFPLRNTDIKEDNRIEEEPDCMSKNGSEDREVVHDGEATSVVPEVIEKQQPSGIEVEHTNIESSSQVLEKSEMLQLNGKPEVAENTCKAAGSKESEHTVSPSPNLSDNNSLPVESAVLDANKPAHSTTQDVQTSTEDVQNDESICEEEDQKVMISQASQTDDLPEGKEIREIGPNEEQLPPPETPNAASTINKPVSSSTSQNKTIATQPTRTAVKTSSTISSPRAHSTVPPRPAYATVSRLYTPRATLETKPAPAKPILQANPRIFRCRTGDTKPMEAGRGIRRIPVDSSPRSQRPALAVRQTRLNCSSMNTLPSRPNLCGVTGRGVKTQGIIEEKQASMIYVQSHSRVHTPPHADDAPESQGKPDVLSASNSSLNSTASSGGKSWADKLKGSSPTAVSTQESEKPKANLPTPAPVTEKQPVVVAQVDMPKPAVNKEDDDSQGWETVKGRSRSRTSPANKVPALGSSLSRSAGNIKLRVDRKGSNGGTTTTHSSTKSHFQHTISAVSLPALAFDDVEEKSHVHIRRQRKYSGSDIKHSDRKQNGKAKLAQDNQRNRKKSLSPKEDNMSTKNSSVNVKNSINASKKDRSIKVSEKENVDIMSSKDASKATSKDIIGQKNKKEKKSLSANKVESNLSNKEKDSESIINKVNVPQRNIVEKQTDIQETNLVENRDKTASEIESSKLEDLLKEDDLLKEESMFDELRMSDELCAQEEMLQKEYQELEKAEIEVDTETDETETDGEATVGPGEEEEGHQEAPEDRATIEAKYEPMLAGMSWAERVDVLEQLEELAARHPGRALQLHQKLSSPSRRRTLAETLRRYQVKQTKAQEKRDRLKEEKAQKLRELSKKIEEVRAAKELDLRQKKEQYELKLKRAEEQRNKHLQGIVKKAHDEEEKLKEIAFINELEAQNKRHDFMTLCQEQEERLQGIQEERQRKQEEKAAKGAAVEERRRLLEAERQARLEKMQERRRKKEERIGREQQEKEKERQELAREKARDREERLSALHAAQLATQEELQKKIQQKQEESARRHEENMEHIRQRALELSILRCSIDDDAPRLVPYETKKLCTLCNVLIGSEVYLLSHLRGKKHQEAIKSQHDGKDPSIEELESYNIKHIIDAPADKIDPKIALDKERQKALKKRCKKIRLRMSVRGQEYEGKRETSQKVESPNKTRLQKCLKDVEKLHRSQGKGQWPDNAVTSLERALGEINRILEKRNALDQVAFQALGGFAALSNILNLALDCPTVPYLPTKCFITTCTAYNLACKGSGANSNYVLYSNKVGIVLDLLLHRLTVLIPDKGRLMSGNTTSGTTSLPVDGVAGALMCVLSMIMTHAEEPCENSTEKSKTKATEAYSKAHREEFWFRIQDVISYTVSVGVVDKLALYCGGVRDPIGGDPQAAAFLLNGLELITALANRLTASIRGGMTRRGEDPTQLVAALQVTELVGAVSMLYGMLLHQGAPSRGSSSPPPPLPAHTIAVTIATIRLLNRVAELDLHMFQCVVGAEGISLQFRHMASYLLWYCSGDREQELLREVIEVVGFFAVRNHDNQTMIQSGYMPTVLQQLCNLPFVHFSDPSLSCHLFPTLLACCVDNEENKAILEQEVSYKLLEEFRLSEAGKSNILVQLLYDKKELQVS